MIAYDHDVVRLSGESAINIERSEVPNLPCWNWQKHMPWVVKAWLEKNHITLSVVSYLTLGENNHLALHWPFELRGYIQKIHERTLSDIIGSINSRLSFSDCGESKRTIEFPSKAWCFVSPSTYLVPW